MTLKKAIEILTMIDDNPPDGVIQDFHDAIKLLIEAGKRVDFSRRDPNRPSEPPLPGETED